MSSMSGLALPKENYKFIITGIVVFVIGYFLMSGGGTDDPNVFDEDKLFSFRILNISPYTVILGYAIIGYGILKRPSTPEAHADVAQALKEEEEFGE